MSAIEISFTFATGEQAQAARRALRYLQGELEVAKAAGFCLDFDYGTACSTEHTVRIVVNEDVQAAVLVTGSTPQAVPLSERPAPTPQPVQRNVVPDSQTSLLDEAGRLDDDGAPSPEIQ